MKELEFLKIIKRTLSKSSHIGDDCAYLDDLGIVITQDNLIEDIHFSREISTPYDIGYKAINVNISDIFASGAKPKYLTVALSLPNDVDNEFVETFYQACNNVANKFDVEIIGGDITGADKICISICAIGTTNGRNISSRRNAKVGDYIITTGVHGASAAGYWLLKDEFAIDNDDLALLVQAHIRPTAQGKLSEEIATKIKTPYAMMDTSDGLIDALYKIAESSDVTLLVEFDKIPFYTEIEHVAKLADVDFKDWIFYGGEDFQIIACVKEEDLKILDKNNYYVIGRVKEKQAEHFVEIDFGFEVQPINDLEKSFNHFKERE